MDFRKGTWIVGALMPALALGCASQESNTDRQVDESYSQVRDRELASERREYISERREQLDELDKEIARMETRLKHEGKLVEPDERAEWSQELFELRQQHSQARAELERAEGATSEEWAEMRGTVGYAIDSLQAGVNEMGSEIGQLFTSDDDDDDDARQNVAGADMGVDLCTIRVDGTSATLTEQGDEFVVRMTATDDDRVAELRDRAERMSREATVQGSRAMAPGERPTGDTRMTTEEQRAALIEEIEVENIDNGVRLRFEPMDGQRAALRERLERDVERIQKQDC